MPFLCMRAKTQRATIYIMKTFFWDMKHEIMQQLIIHFGRALKKIMVQGMSSNFSRKNFKVNFVTFPIIGNTFEKNK